MHSWQIIPSVCTAVWQCAANLPFHESNIDASHFPWASSISASRWRNALLCFYNSTTSSSPCNSEHSHKLSADYSCLHTMIWKKRMTVSLNGFPSKIKAFQHCTFCLVLLAYENNHWMEHKSMTSRIILFNLEWLLQNLNQDAVRNSSQVDKRKQACRNIFKVWIQSIKICILGYVPVTHRPVFLMRITVTPIPTGKPSVDEWSQTVFSAACLCNFIKHRLKGGDSGEDIHYARWCRKGQLVSFLTSQNLSYINVQCKTRHGIRNLFNHGTHFFPRGF